MAVIGLFCFLLFLLECRSDEQLQIVGGDSIAIEKVPYFAIYRWIEHVHGCGASIVTDQFVVSAAHCHPHSDDIIMEVVVGTDRIRNGQHYDILASYPHPKFNVDGMLSCDVVVLKLAKKLVFNARVQPIKLAEPGMVIEDGAVFQTMGFGVTDPRKPNQMSDILLAVEVPYVNHENCSRAYDFEITKYMICAGEEGKDSCQNDSGGPLVYKDRLVGIVSFGLGCAERDIPGVYARVSTLRDFIDDVIKNHA